MQKHHQTGLMLAIVLTLSACSGSSNLSSMVPDRRPDYRSSSMENALEVPPDLRDAAIDSRYNIPDMNPSAVASYNAYNDERVQRNQRGFIKVLPPLQGVEVVEQSGELPYIVVNTAPEDVWQMVKRYWNQNGIRLAVDNPSIGIMETDWLLNKAALPSTGISGVLDSLLGFVSDTGERDRYRIRFSRNGVGQTIVTLIYTQSVEKAEYEGIGKGELSGYSWQLSDNQNPELQLEMTRRIALYIANELQRQGKMGQATDRQAQTFAQLGQTQNGLNILVFNGSYDQAWRALGNALDNASFAIEQTDYNNGTYRVQYSPQSNAKKTGLWDKLWGSSDDSEQNAQPYYLVRLADQNGQAIAIVQNNDGSNAAPEAARQILEAVYTTL